MPSKYLQAITTGGYLLSAIGNDLKAMTGYDSGNDRLAMPPAMSGNYEHGELLLLTSY